jgi:hypothetical protein
MTASDARNFAVQHIADSGDDDQPGGENETLLHGGNNRPKAEKQIQNRD